jgi:hypothetical protein
MREHGKYIECYIVAMGIEEGPCFSNDRKCDGETVALR